MWKLIFPVDFDENCYFLRKFISKQKYLTLNAVHFLKFS